MKFNQIWKSLVLLTFLFIMFRKFGRIQIKPGDGTCRTKSSAESCCMKT